MDTTATSTTLDDVRLAIFRQHTQLTELLDELESHANAVLAGGGDAKTMSRTLELLNARLERHLEDVEAQLGRWLPSPDTEAGQGRLAEYADQRSRVRGLLHDRDVFGDACSFARAVLTGAHQLRKDVTREHAKLGALR